jgi:type IV secretory pathway TrbL component
MFNFFVAETSDLTEISKIISDSFQVILSDFKEIMLYVIKYAVPIIGIIIAMTIGVKAYKHISGVDDELDAANANTDEFLNEYYDWLDSHPNY